MAITRLTWPFGSFGLPALRFFSFILNLRDDSGLNRILRRFHRRKLQDRSVLRSTVVILVLV